MKIDSAAAQAARAGGADDPRRQRRSRARVRPADGAARAGDHHRDVGRRALRGARSGHQGVARRRRLREVVLRGRELPVRAVLRRVHRRLRRARSRRDRRRARRLPRLPRDRGLVLRRGDGRGSRSPGRVLSARHRVGRALPGAAGRHPRRQPARLPDRAAARIGRRAWTPPARPARVQRREVVRPAVGDELRRRLPGGRSARVRGRGARVRGRDRRRLRGAARAPLDPRRRRERSRASRPPRARPAATAPRPAASRRSRPASASPRSPTT